MSEAPPDPWIGQRLGGRYEIKGFLGEGGWARVYRGFDTSLGRDVALKVPHAHIVENEKDAEAFRREIRKLVAVEHPSVVRVHDAVAAPDGRPVAVLEFMRGGSLDSRLDAAAGGTQSLDEVLSWLTPLADALDHLHGVVGLVHADVKPQNVLFDGSSRPRLSDFGIVVSLDPGKSSRLMRTASTGGTPLYMAPELLLDGQKPSARSDQYALAVTAYQALAGRLPYAVPDTDDAILFIAQWGRALEKGAPLDLHEAAREVPKAASAIVMRALARTPEARYRSCLAFVDALRAAIAPAPVAVEPPKPPAPPVHPPKPPRPPKPPPDPAIRRVLIGMAVVVVLAGGAFLLSGGEPKSKGSDGVPVARSTVTRSLVVEEPAEGALLGASEVRVAGRAVGEAGDLLTVEGRPVMVTGDRFSTTITVPSDGTHDIEVVYGPPTDPKQRTVLRRIEVDTTKPMVEITGPVGRRATYPPATVSARIAGRVRDVHPRSVSVGLAGATLAPDGSFEADVPLVDGEQSIRVAAVDLSGHASDPVDVVLTRQRVVRPVWADELAVAKAKAEAQDWEGARSALDRGRALGARESDLPRSILDGIANYDADPVLEVTEPVSGWTVTAPTVRVRGELTRGRASDVVSVGGRAVRMGPGPFNVTVDLTAPGSIELAVSVKDGLRDRGTPVVRSGSFLKPIRLLTIQTETVPFRDATELSPSKDSPREPIPPVVQFELDPGLPDGWVVPKLTGTPWHGTLHLGDRHLSVVVSRESGDGMLLFVDENADGRLDDRAERHAPTATTPRELEQVRVATEWTLDFQLGSVPVRARVSERLESKTGSVRWGKPKAEFHSLEFSETRPPGLTATPRVPGKFLYAVESSGERPLFVVAVRGEGDALSFLVDDHPDLSSITALPAVADSQSRAGRTISTRWAASATRLGGHEDVKFSYTESALDLGGSLAGTTWCRGRSDVDGEAYALAALDGDFDGRLTGPYDMWWFGPADAMPRSRSQGLIDAGEPCLLDGGRFWLPGSLDAGSPAHLVLAADARFAEESLRRRFERTNERVWFPRFRSEGAMFLATDIAKREGIDVVRPRAATPPSFRFARSLADAKLIAAREGKPLLIELETDWCVWCRRLDFYTYPDAVVAERLGRFTVAKINSDLDPDKMLEATGWNGIPALAVYGPDGAPVHFRDGDHIVDHIGGWRGPQKFVALLDAALAAFEDAKAGKLPPPLDPSPK